MVARVQQELIDKLRETTLTAHEMVEAMLAQCTKLPVAGGGNPTLFGSSRRNAAVAKNTEVLTECEGSLQKEAQQLIQTATKGLGMAGSNMNEVEE